MGRLIDADRLKEVFSRNVVGGNVYFDLIDVQPTVEAIPKADYENRLKSDMVAMLTELQSEIEKIKPLEPTDDDDWQYGCFHGLELMQDKCFKLIQQKINKLKENN